MQKLAFFLEIGVSCKGAARSSGELLFQKVLGLKVSTFCFSTTRIYNPAFVKVKKAASSTRMNMMDISSSPYLSECSKIINEVLYTSSDM
jgi:hypothetical protein